MSDELSNTGAVDVLASEPQEPERSARWWVVAGVGAVVAALVAGITYGVAALSGGGGQPEDALPSGAVAFADIDFDPPAGQKIDAYRFLRRFPSLRERLGDDDARQAVFDSVAAGAGWDELDFATDVAPWLGQRVGVGVYPGTMFAAAARPGGDARDGSGSAVTVVALQVTDEDAARTGLDRLLTSPGGADKPGYVLADGYALVTQSQAVASAVADRAARGSLAQAERFAADTADLGDGFASAWFDGSSLTELLPAAGVLGLNPLGIGGLNPSAISSSMRMAYVMRFAGADVVELAGHVTGAPTVPGGDVPLTGLVDLPASSAVALGLGGGEALVDPLMSAMRKQAAAASGDGLSADDLVALAERSTGLDLPDDLRLLLGSNLLVALDRSGLRGGAPEVGARVTTTEPARADSLLDQLVSGAWEVPPFVHRATDDGYVAASTEAQAARITAGAGGERLGDVPAFRRALPDVDAARFAAWVDLDAVLQAMAGTRDGGLPADLRPLDGVGVTATTDGHGAGAFRVRLLAH